MRGSIKMALSGFRQEGLISQTYYRAGSAPRSSLRIVAPPTPDWNTLNLHYYSYEGELDLADTYTITCPTGGGRAERGVDVNTIASR